MRADRCDDAIRKHAPDRMLISVADNGTGMSDAVLARAFQPLYTTKGKAGSGLGLASVKRFAEECGAEIRVRSALGAGTEVTIAFDVQGSRSISN